MCCVAVVAVFVDVIIVVAAGVGLVVVGWCCVLVVVDAVGAVVGRC